MASRALTALTATAVLLVTTALPAFAHARLEQKQVPASSSQELSMVVPGEREGSTNDAVEIQVPAAFTDVACGTVAGWTCDTSSSSGGTVLTWERADDGDPEAALAFTAMTPDEPGTYRLPTIQVYSDGTEVAWIQTEDGADRPAPALTVAAADASVEQETEAPDTAHGDPAQTEEPAKEETATDATEDEQPTDDASPVPAEEVDPEPEVESSSPFLPAILAVVAIGGVAAVLIRRRQVR